MADQPLSEYCPKCQLVQPTFEFIEDNRTVRRCVMCGFPVESGLVLESAQALGVPSPPEVKILCVDDDPLILQMNGDILRFHGYKVLTALDGPSALEIAARERPALVLLDIMMPGMDGFEVCRHLKANPGLRSIPIIILTAMTDTKLNVRAFDAGAELALRKPAEPAMVLRTVEAALALVCMSVPAEQDQLVAALKAEGYAAQVATSAADAIQRLRFMAYALAVIREGFGSAAGEGNPVLDHVAKMPMGARRGKG